MKNIPSNFFNIAWNLLIGPEGCVSNVKRELILRIYFGGHILWNCSHESAKEPYWRCFNIGSCTFVRIISHPSRANEFIRYIIEEIGCVIFLNSPSGSKPLPEPMLNHISMSQYAFTRPRWPVNSPHKWPVTRKMFPFDDVIMQAPWLKPKPHVVACCQPVIVFAVTGTGTKALISDTHPAMTAHWQNAESLLSLDRRFFYVKSWRVHINFGWCVVKCWCIAACLVDHF